MLKVLLNYFQIVSLLAAKAIAMIKLKYWLLTLILIQACDMAQKPLVIGHRGAMGHETENTLASIQKALDLGVDMIEIDIFKVKSGELVVFHDKTLDRLSDAEGKIEEYEYSRLNEVLIDGRHRIPLLQEVLKLIDNKVGLNIELKGKNTTESLHKILEHHVKEQGWAMDNFIVSSFDWDELRAMRNLNQELRIAVLTGKDPANAIAVARELKAEAINPHFKNLTRENVIAMKKSGFKIYTWTVNDPQDIIAAKRHGVDGIITNFPERVH